MEWILSPFPDNSYSVVASTCVLNIWQDIGKTSPTIGIWFRHYCTLTGGTLYRHIAHSQAAAPPWFITPLKATCVPHWAVHPSRLSDHRYDLGPSGQNIWIRTGDFFVRGGTLQDCWRFCACNSTHSLHFVDNLVHHIEETRNLCDPPLTSVLRSWCYHIIGTHRCDPPIGQASYLSHQRYRWCHRRVLSASSLISSSCQ